MSVAADDGMTAIPLGLDELAAIAAGAAPVTSDGELRDALREVLADVAIEGQLTIRAGGAVRDGHCWLGLNGGLIAIADGAGVLTSLTSAESFSADLARLLELGPRAERLPETAIRVRRATLLRVTGADGDMTVEQAAQAIDALALSDPVERAWLEALASPRLIHWRVAIAPLGHLADTTETRWCEVLDCGSRGILLVWSPDLDADADVLLVAATPTDVWRVLSSLLGDEPPVPPHEPDGVHDSGPS